MEEEEIWKDCIGFDGYYAVSNLGRVKSLERTIYDKNGKEKRIKERIRKISYNHKNNNEPEITFSVDAIHTRHNIIGLVGMNFVGFKEENQIYQRKNKVRTDVRASNIEITTRTEARILEHKMGVNFAPVCETHTNNRIEYERKNFIFDGLEIISIKCRKCKKTKSVDEYNNHLSTDKYGHNYKYKKHVCKECESDRKGIKHHGKLKHIDSLRKNGTQKCSDCNTIKPFECFSKNSNYHTGYSTVCKNCMNIRNKKYAEKRRSYNDLLTDSVVRHRLRQDGFRNEDITPEIIETKRQLIKLNREIRCQNSKM